MEYGLAVVLVVTFSILALIMILGYGLMVRGFVIHWFKKRSSDTRSKLEKMKPAEGLEAILNDDCPHGTFERTGMRCGDCLLNALEPESAPKRVPQGHGWKKEAEESEAKDAEQLQELQKRLRFVCYGLEDRLHRVIELAEEVLAHPTHSTQTDLQPESPEKQTSSRRTATQPETHVGKRTVLYRAPKDVDGVHKPQTGSETSGSREGIDTSVRVRAVLSEQGNQIADRLGL